MKKKFLALTMSLIMAASLMSGCASGSGSKDTAAGNAGGNNGAGTTAGAGETAQGKGDGISGSKELMAYVTASLSELDPQMDSNSDNKDITGLLGEGLTRHSEDGEGAVLGMADSYTVSEDGLTYTFTLKDGMKWSDGEAVTAQQFVYAFQRYYNPVNASEPAAYALDYIQNAQAVYNSEKNVEDLGIKAIDEKTVEVTMGALYPENTVLDILANPDFYPLREDKLTKGGDGWSTNPATKLSNGPYSLEAFNPDASVVLVRNDGYTGEQPANADRITFMIYADTSAADVAMLNGELNYYKNVSTSLKNQLSDKAQVEKYATLSTACLFMNHKSTPLDDVNVRKAICLAIDNQYVVDTLEDGETVAATGYIGNGFMDVVDGDFRTNGGDLVPAYSDAQLEEAKQLLADAGYADGANFPTLTYLTTNTEKGKLRGEFFQALLKDALGITVEVAAYDVPTYLTYLDSGDFDFSYIYTDASCNNCSELLNYCVSGSNAYNINIPDYDALISQASSETDMAKRSKLLHDAEQMLLTEYYAFHPICYSSVSMAFSTDARNMTATATGTILLNYMTLEGWN